MKSLEENNPFEVSSNELCAAPRISVVMLTFNHEAYLKEAIQGVIDQQTDFQIEILIGDDCSKDGTLNIALSFQTRFPKIIRVFVRDVNAGMHDNFAHLITQARGEFIAFCEGDDFWNSPLKLQRQFDMLSSDALVGAVHTDYNHLALVRGRWRTLASVNSYFNWEIPSGWIFEQLTQRNFVRTVTLCCRRSLVLNYLASEFPRRGYLVGDWPMWLFFSCQMKFAYVPEATSTYRRTPGSATNKGHLADHARAVNAIAMISDFRTQRPCVGDFPKLKVPHVVYELARTSLIVRDAAGLRLARQEACRLTGKRHRWLFVPALAAIRYLPLHFVALTVLALTSWTREQLRPYRLPQGQS